MTTTTTQPAGHGLQGEWTAPDWPPITLDFARRVLAQYPQLGQAHAILTVSPRPFSSASVVQCDAGRVFIKRHSTLVRRASDLAEEHAFMQHLRAHGLNVPEIFIATNAATAIEIANEIQNKIPNKNSGEPLAWSCEVQSVPNADDLYGDALSWTPFASAADAESAGQILARLHLAAASYPAPARKTRHLVSSFSIFSAHDPWAALAEYLHPRPELSTHIAQTNTLARAFELLLPAHEQLLPHLATLPHQWTHNDLHASNLLWQSSGHHAHAAAIIDFGLSDRTFAIHDLALAIERNCVEWLALPHSLRNHTPLPVHTDQMRALIAGYQTVRPLSAAERRALRPMLALCHAEFALSEADYFLSVLNSGEKTTLALDGYLLGHAQWFASADGARFLDAVEGACQQ